MVERSFVFEDITFLVCIAGSQMSCYKKEKICNGVDFSYFEAFIDIENMIRLSDQRPFAHGNHREVYLHPEKSDRCLRLITEDWHKCDRWRRANLVARLLRPKWSYDENEGEMHFSQVLPRRLDAIGKMDPQGAREGFSETTEKVGPRT